MSVGSLMPFIPNTSFIVEALELQVHHPLWSGSTLTSYEGLAFFPDNCRAVFFVCFLYMFAPDSARVCVLFYLRGSPNVVAQLSR